MKVGLLLVSLSLVAYAQAKYDLSCAKSELSIRWPSYESNSEYYVCSRLFGRKMTVTCNPGEVFTFVLQSCTSPNRYIPAPALEALPTSAPLMSKPNESGFLTPAEIPNHPPLLTPPVVNVPESHPVGPPTLPHLDVVGENKPHEETKVVLTEENTAGIVDEADKVTPPLPPTPAPTPPLVEKHTGKKPGASSGKKPVIKKKKSTTSEKTTPVIGKETSKKPKTTSKKKPAAQKKGKQTSKADNKAKKSVKTPKVTDKKPQKA